MSSSPTTKYVRKEKMAIIWERKKKNILYYLLKGPLVFSLIFANSILTSWIFHVSYAVFTDAPDHMSLVEWIEHLYGLLI
jgi:hypothetical protein